MCTKPGLGVVGMAPRASRLLNENSINRVTATAHSQCVVEELNTEELDMKELNTMDCT